MSNALIGHDPATSVAQLGDKIQLSDFVARLKEEDLSAPPQTAMYHLLRYEIWWLELAERAIQRLRVLEELEIADAHNRGAQEAAARAKQLRQLLGIGGLLVHTHRRDDSYTTVGRGAEWDPSSIPDDRPNLLHLLPYHSAIDGLHGGLELAWEPTFRAGGVFEWRMYLPLRVAPRWLSSGIGTGPVLLFPSLWPGLSHVGLYGLVEEIWWDWGGQDTPGALTKISAQLNLEFATKFRVGLELGIAQRRGEVMKSEFEWDLSPESINLSLGIVDLGGLFYWLAF